MCWKWNWFLRNTRGQFRFQVLDIELELVLFHQRISIPHETFQIKFSISFWLMRFELDWEQDWFTFVIMYGNKFLIGLVWSNYEIKSIWSINSNGMGRKSGLNDAVKHSKKFPSRKSDSNSQAHCFKSICSLC